MSDVLGIQALGELAPETAQELVDQYVKEVVDDAKATHDVKVSDPGFHAIGFVAKTAVRRVLTDVMQYDQLGEDPSGAIEGDIVEVTITEGRQDASKVVEMLQADHPLGWLAALASERIIEDGTSSLTTQDGEKIVPAVLDDKAIDAEQLFDLLAERVLAASSIAYTLGRLDQINDLRGNNVRRAVRADEMEATIDQTLVLDHIIGFNKDEILAALRKYRSFMPKLKKLADQPDQSEGEQ
jgi:hypothetical protein